MGSSNALSWEGTLSRPELNQNRELMGVHIKEDMISNGNVTSNSTNIMYEASDFTVRSFGSFN